MWERWSRLPRELSGRLARLPRPVAFAAMVALLAIGASGVAGRSQVSFEGSASRAYVPFLVAGVIVVGVITLMTAIAMSGSRGPIGKPQLRLAGPILIGFVSLTIAYFVVRNLTPRDEERLVRTAADDVTGGAPLWSWGIIVAFVALLGALFLLFVYVRRSPRIDDLDAIGDLALAQQVAEVIAAGRAALRNAANTRAAVIACFADMESALERAGVEHRLADTPAELLHRATANGLLSRTGATAATELARLYHRARFSEQTLPSNVRADAERALEVLHDEFVARGNEASERAQP